MKKSLLCGALLTLINTPILAETQPQPMTTPQATQTTAPAKVEPANPVMNCEYKINANIKIVEPSLVLTWAEKATTQAFDFDPNNLDAQMSKLQECFTQQGWDGFNTALQKSGNLNAIKAQHLTVSSLVDGKIQINDTQANLWKMTVPLQVVYQNDKEKITQLLNIQLTVGRKPSGDLGITQMIATPRAAEGQPATTTNPEVKKP